MTADPMTMELLRVLDRWASEQVAIGVPRMLVAVTVAMHAADSWDKALREHTGVAEPEDDHGSN